MVENKYAIYIDMPINQLRFEYDKIDSDLYRLYDKQSDVVGYSDRELDALVRETEDELNYLTLLIANRKEA